MDIERLAAGLSPLERKVLPCVTNATSIHELVAKTGLSDVEVLRALQWLEGKGFVRIQSTEREIVELAELGKKYLHDTLPERRFLEALRTGAKTLSQILAQSHLDQEEASVSIGTLRRANLIAVKKDAELSAHLTPEGHAQLDKPFAQEVFLSQRFPLDPGTLDQAGRETLAALLSRKRIIELKKIKDSSATITELGMSVLSKMPVHGNLERVTPELLRSGGWKGRSFRQYELGARVSALSGGRRHFVNEAISYARQIWLELGFEEMQGSIVQSGFWNFDALFTAQDHPVREMQDTFYLTEDGELPDKELVHRVKSTHENGWTTGSKGWGGAWSEAEARRQVLRTHTTVLSAHALSRLEKLPAKLFSVSLAFRNETMDWSHLFEFPQSDGIVVSEDADFTHLMGYLREFFSKMGYDKVRCRPAYFPYTEPSVEVDVYDETHGKWIELGGAGIFRPEVVKPLMGSDVPVLAWGLGLGRIIMPYFGLTDIRDMHSNNLSMLRERRTWMR